MEAIGEDGSIDLSRERPLSELMTGYTYFREGDVTFAKITPCFENGKGARMGGLGPGFGFGTTELTVLRPNECVLSGRFLYYLFISRTFRDQGESHMYGAGGQKRVPDEFVRTFEAPLPPLGEQEVIAEFLDRETTNIEDLIAEQRRLIELLTEKRQSVISHAVTNGLKADVPMKDSGVEWLGQIPRHWQVLPLKRLATVRTGVAKGKDLRGVASISVPYLRVANVQDGYLDLEEVKEIDIPIGDLDRYRLRRGDVLMNEGGDFDKLGRGAVWNGEIDPCITQNHVFAVSPHGVTPDWLSLVT